MKKTKLVVVFSSHLSVEENDQFIDHIKNTCGIKLKDLQVEWHVNHNEYSLSEVYNKALKRCWEDETQNTIIVYTHNDVIFNTKDWGKRLLYLFNRNDVDILGIAGTTYMSDTGTWWQDRSRMYGVVNHQEHGKQWETRYSEDILGVKEMIVVDGVFFACDPTNIETGFDEDFKGFHFYDIAFCYPNFLDGCNIGVTTGIRITHKSVGHTNEQWEENRKQFVEKYKEELPYKLRNEKIRVLIGCLSFKDYTGSELYFYELAKELVKQNCEVSIVSNIGDPLASKARRYGIKVFDIKEPPTYKLGDGQWKLNQETISQYGVLYKMADYKFDILHVSHRPIVEALIPLYPETKVISTIHSEVIPQFESPVINNRIEKYIAIRPEIKEYVEGFDIPGEKIDVVYNPLDYNRFKKVKPKNRSHTVILYVGTIDYLRKETLFDLAKTTKENGDELWILGKNSDNYLSELMDKHVKYFPPTFDVEKYVQKCDQTAGILLGRTTIEGWLCGKPGWIYQVDDKGHIESKELHPVPDDVEKFRSDYVASQIKEIYESVLEN